MENDEVSIINCMCYCFSDIIKLQGFDFHKFLLDEISYGNILIYDISSKISIIVKPLRIRLDIRWIDQRL